MIKILIGICMFFSAPSFALNPGKSIDQRIARIQTKLQLKPMTNRYTTNESQVLQIEIKLQLEIKNERFSKTLDQRIYFIESFLGMDH